MSAPTPFERSRAIWRDCQTLRRVGVCVWRLTDRYGNPRPQVVLFGMHDGYAIGKGIHVSLRR